MPWSWPGKCRRRPEGQERDTVSGSDPGTTGEISRGLETDAQEGIDGRSEPPARGVAVYRARLAASPALATRAVVFAITGSVVPLMFDL